MKREKSTLTGAGAAVLAVLGNITCCGAPIAAGILASVGIGASQLQFLKSFQPFLIGIALLSLLIGFYRLYFKKANSCCNTETNKGNAKSSNKGSKRFLWLVTAFTLIMLVLTFNMNSSAPDMPATENTTNCSGGSCESSPKIAPQKNCGSCTTANYNSKNGKTVNGFEPLTDTREKSCCLAANNLRTAYFSIEGLTSACCIKPIRAALLKAEGIKLFRLSFDKKMVGIKYNQKEISLEQIEKTLDATGYNATLVQ
ncbi:MAG: heavy-metal-associated domain-containing protein [Marinifilaceae bacterium]